MSLNRNFSSQYVTSASIRCIDVRHLCNLFAATHDLCERDPI